MIGTFAGTLWIVDYSFVDGEESEEEIDDDEVPEEGIDDEEIRVEELAVANDYVEIPVPDYYRFEGELPVFTFSVPEANRDLETPPSSAPTSPPTASAGSPRASWRRAGSWSVCTVGAAGALARNLQFFSENKMF